MTLVDKIILNAEKSEYFKELFDKLEKLNYYSFLKLGGKSTIWRSYITCKGHTTGTCEKSGYRNPKYDV